MSRLIFLEYLEELLPLKRSAFHHSTYAPGLCVSLMAFLIAMGASEAKSHHSRSIRLTEYSLARLAVVGTCAKARNVHLVRASMSEVHLLCEGMSGQFVAQNVYGPVPLNGSPVQPGYMQGPSGLPPTQPGYVPPGTTAAPPVQGPPNSAPDAYPPNQAGYGSRRLEPSGTEPMNADMVLRATNTARMRSEALNGGLRVYRTASCMYQQSGGECLIQRGSEGFLFRFLGGEPGWQQLGKSPSIETEILIGPDGKSVTKILYNGSPRDASRAGSSPGTKQPATIQP